MNTAISADDLRRAASIKDQIESLEAQYRGILDGTAPHRGRKPGPKAGPAASERLAPVAKKRLKKRKLSPEARARIVAAVKARWARVKSGK
jgi:hypothetical protein